MSTVTKVAETSRRGLEPVNPKLAGQYDQIVALLAQRLGPDHAFLLAEPVPLGGASTGDADTAWYCKGTGTSQALSTLPEAEATAVRAKLEALLSDIAALADQMQNEGDTSRELGRLLRDALVLPDTQRVYAVGGRPVLVDWGNRTQAGASAPALGQTGFLVGAGGAGPAARRVAGAPPPPPIDDGGIGRDGDHPSGAASLVPRTPASARRNWIARAALWVVFVVLLGATGVRLLDACALGPTVWPEFVRHWLPGSCPAVTSNPEVQAANDKARAVEAQIRQQETVIAVKTARCDAQCGPPPSIPVVNPPPPPPQAPTLTPSLPITAPEVVRPPAVPNEVHNQPIPVVPGKVEGRVTAPTVKDVDTRVANLERGLVEISLAWDGPADLDLRVICPDRKQIQFRDRANCGGRQVKDMGVGGGAADAHSIEHIIWDAQPPVGTYTVDATLFSRYTESHPSIPYTVVLRFNGKVIKENSGQLATNGQTEVVFTFNSPISN